LSVVGRRYAANAYPFARTAVRRFGSQQYIAALDLGELLDEGPRGQLIQQPFEQEHLLGVDLLRGSPVEPPQQVLELVLELLDRAGALLPLLQQLLTLGPQQLVLLAKLREFGVE
jgi:hypothetical protein